MTRPRSTCPVRRIRLISGLQFRPSPTDSSEDRPVVEDGERERNSEKKREREAEHDSASQILLAMYVKWKRRLVVRRRNGIIIVGRFGAAIRFLVNR